MRGNTNKELYWNEWKDTLVNEKSERNRCLVEIKDTVIGSNRQKGALIAHGLVPILLDISSECEETEDKLNALIILGSLARGTNAQVQILLKEYNVLLVLFTEAVLRKNSSKCIEVCLTTMQSIYQHPEASTDIFFSESGFLALFLSLASAENSLRIQICVTTILVSLCQTYDDQIRLLNAGTVHILARMICLENEHIQIPALRCLSSMCYCNRSVADNICVTSYQGRSLPGILNSLMSRLFSPEIQLTSARCLTYIYRCGTLPPSDSRIVHKTLPCLARLCSDYFDLAIRAAAAEAFSYLIEINAELQETAAINNHLLKSLSELVQINQLSTRQSALKCFASLAANDEHIRKRVVEVPGLLNVIFDSLNECSSQVKLASIKCLHSLSRSVYQLRTTFQDHTVWKPVLFLLSSEPAGDLLTAVLSIICNLVLEFSPSKEPLLNVGVTEKLCDFTQHSDAALRVNSVWALMNMSFQSDEHIKVEIYNTLGSRRILELLRDSDKNVVMKTLGLLRNLLSKSLGINLIMNNNSTQLMEALNSILESYSSPEVKEQVLCIVGNIAAEAREDYVINNVRLLNQLGDFIFNDDPKLQAGALFAIKNIITRKDSCTEEHYSRLVELNIIRNIYELNENKFQTCVCSDEYIQKTLKEILVQCQNFCPRKKC